MVPLILFGDFLDSALEPVLKIVAHRMDLPTPCLRSMNPLANAAIKFGRFIPRSRHLDERHWWVTENPRLLFGGLLVCVGYYLGAKLGFALTFHPRPVSVMWPPNSILLAALLLTPPRSWWFFLLCALPAHLAIQLQSNVPPGMMFCWFISNSAEALIGASVTRSIVRGPFRLATLANTSAFLVGGVFLGPFLSSFLDGAFVQLNKWGQGTYSEVWRVRFFANVLTSLAIAPAIVVWAQMDFRKWRTMNWKRWVEIALLTAGLIGVGFHAFVAYEPGPHTDPALLYAPLPFLLWAGVRFGGPGATLAAFVTSLIAIWGAAHGRGPFSTNSPEANASSIQMFLIVAIVLLLLLSAAKSDREKADERYAKAFRANPDAIIISREKDGQIIELNERAEALFGFHRAEALGHTASDLNNYFCEADLLKVIAETSGGTSLHDLELPFRTKAGELRRALVSSDTEEIQGERCLIVVVRDISEQRRAEQEALEVSSKLITAQEDERKRIARDLHDDLNQRLALLSVEIDIVGQESEKTEGPVHEHLARIASQVKELSGEVHRLSYHLHPAKLDQLGLVVAARTFCREVGVQSKIRIRFEQVDVPRDLEPGVALCLYRVLQEALQNSVRHSGAAEIDVRLTRETDQLRLIITDAGKGFVVEEALHNSGLGLVSMRERVRQVHGSIHFNSAPGAGAQINVTVPLFDKPPGA